MLHITIFTFHTLNYTEITKSRRFKLKREAAANFQLDLQNRDLTRSRLR